MTASRILVVDDTPSNVKLLADVLGAKGYTILTAASGAEALEAIERHELDLVLLDVMMPGMSGYDVCRKIRANPSTKMLPVVWLTSTSLMMLGGAKSGSLIVCTTVSVAGSMRSTLFSPRLPTRSVPS